MEITFLGTGTSHGIPVMTCNCAVCQSDDPKNKRTRSSLWIREKETSLLIDTATEFRLQALRADIQQVDAVLYTHCHADHVFGFDDLRVFSKLSGQSVPIYGNEPTVREMREVFSYVFRKTQEGGGKPQVETIVVEDSFWVKDVMVEPIPVVHGRLPILGYRIGKLAYITDCSYIPPESMDRLQDLEILILGVIRHEPHPTHMNVSQALDLVQKLKAKRTYFTHISHLLEHQELAKALPEGVFPAYDGLTLHV
ncbi:MAG: MBL fold metallo-hydrolase [Firmicutes bacterium]|nr:MBL fold metallo-hydrolase [Bacillota bacterium]